MFGLIADLLSSFLTILFPIFASYKALRSSETSQLAPLLVYWVVLSVVLLAESWTVFILGWFPFYSWFRLLFLCYLVLPQTQGARVLYQQYIDPFLFRHEREIEQFLDRGHERAKELGLQYFYRAIELIREKVLGLPPQQQQQGGGGAAPPSGVAGYAQSIFSQFNAPSGGSSGNAPAPANDWFSSVSSAIAGSQGQREADMDGSGSPLRKNRSDNSFHHVSHEDTRERSPAGGSGWASGWFGQQGDQGGSSAVDFAARAAEEMSRARGS